MRIPYGFILTGSRALRINKDEADVIAMIFDFCEVPLENTKQIPSYPKIQGYA